MADPVVWLGWGTGDAGPFQAFRFCAFIVCAVPAVVVLGVRFRGAPTNVAPAAMAADITVAFVLFAKLVIDLDTFTPVFEAVIVFVLVRVALAIVADLTRIVFARLDRRRR